MKGQEQGQATEQTPAGTDATGGAKATTPPARRKRPLGGFLIAGASLALLFGIAALKGRVTDDNTDSERGLQ
ncbi:MAG TPA: hypothetical protein VGW12_09550 [Pyrinomonadaceae bacterium]|nr:hypothetical protein [Pyrinomonadaceae bacterium]